MFRNNKHSETSQRFSIKKYSFGVASALVGVFFAVGANYAQADDLTTPTPAAPVVSVAQTPAPAAPVATPAPVTQTPAAQPATQAPTTPAPVAQTTTQATSTSAPVAQTTTPAPNAATTTANTPAQKEADKKAEEKTKAEVKATQTRVTPKWTANTVTEITTEIKRQEKEELKEYVVQWGDTLNRISKATGTSVADLVRYNNIKNPNKIYVGDLLKNVLYTTPSNLDPRNQTDPRNRGQQNGRRSWIANSVEEIRNEIDTQTKANNTNYVIQWGDTLSRISKASGKSVKELQTLNNIKNINKIYAGKELKGVIVPTNTGQNNNNNNGNNIPNPVEEKYVVVSGYAYNSLDNIIDEGEFILSDGENSQKITLNYETEGYHYYHILTGKTYTLSGTDFEVTLTAKDENQVDIVNKVGKFTAGKHIQQDDVLDVKFRSDVISINELDKTEVNGNELTIHNVYDFKVGDKIIQQGSVDNGLEGFAFRVVDSKVIDGKTQVSVAKITKVADIVDVIKYKENIPLNKIQLKLAEGVKVVDNTKIEIDKDRFILSNKDNYQFGIDQYVDLAEKFGLTNELSKSDNSISLQAKFSGDMSWDYLYDANLITKDTGHINMGLNLSTEANVEFGRTLLEKSKSEELEAIGGVLKDIDPNNRIRIVNRIESIGSFYYPVAGILRVGGDLYVYPNLEVSGALETKLKAEAKASIHKRIGEDKPLTGNIDYSVDVPISAELEGKVELVFKPEPALKLLNLDNDLVELELEGAPIGVGGSGKVSGKVGVKNGDAYAEFEKAEFEGKAYTRVSATAKILEDDSSDNDNSLDYKFFEKEWSKELMNVNTEKDSEKENNPDSGNASTNKDNENNTDNTSNNIDFSQFQGKYKNNRNETTLEIKEDGSLFVDGIKVNVVAKKEGEGIVLSSVRANYFVYPVGTTSKHHEEVDALKNRIVATDGMTPPTLYYKEESISPIKVVKTEFKDDGTITLTIERTNTDKEESFKEVRTYPYWAERDEGILLFPKGQKTIVKKYFSQLGMPDSKWIRKVVVTDKEGRKTYYPFVTAVTKGGKVVDVIADEV